MAITRKSINDGPDYRVAGAADFTAQYQLDSFMDMQPMPHGEFVASSSYNHRLFHPSQLRALVQHIAPQVQAFMAQTGAEAVAVTGKSGLAVAFALAMRIDLRILTVRKPEENSHGAPVEGDGQPVRKYIVLDDFVASGATVQRIRSRIERAAGGFGTAVPELVGVFGWDYLGGTAPDLVRSKIRGVWYTGPSGRLPDGTRLPNLP